MNRYHQIYYNYLAKIQACKKPWPFASVGITGVLVKYEYMADIFPFEASRNQVIKYCPAFKLYVQPEEPAEPVIIYIDVNGTKAIHEMTDYKRFQRYYADVKILAIGDSFFKHKGNIKNLKDIGVWIDRAPRGSKQKIEENENQEN